MSEKRHFSNDNRPKRDSIITVYKRDDSLPSIEPEADRYVGETGTVKAYSAGIGAYVEFAGVKDWVIIPFEQCG